MQSRTKWITARAVAAVGSALFSLWTGAKLMLDQLGRVDIALGLGNPEGLVAQALTWLFQTPAWVPGGLAALLTFALIWLLWPQREKAVAASPLVNDNESPLGSGDHAEMVRTVSDPPPINPNGLFPPTITTTPPPDFEPTGLYLARVTVDGPNTLPDLYLRLGFLFFNASRKPITIQRVEGAVRGFRKIDGERREFDPFPPPRLEDAPQIAHLAEHLVIIEQRLPRTTAEAVSEILSRPNDTLELDLTGLNVIYSAGTRHKEMRLPLWDKITVKQTNDVYFVGRIIEARVNITLGAFVTL